MITQHLSDEELQLIAMGEPVDNTEITLHAAHCAVCQEQIAFYKTLINDIHEQPVSVFDFDLERIVLPQVLPLKKSSARTIQPFLLAAFVTVCLYVFRYNFLHLFTGSSSWYLLLSGLAALTIIVLKTISIYHKYQQQIQKLNLFK